MANSFGQFTGWVSLSHILKSQPSCTSHKPRASYQRWQVHRGLQHGICLHAATQSYLSITLQPVSYRDEHSAPFGWRTRSQQNLHFDMYGEEAEGEGEPVPGLDRVTSRRWAQYSPSITQCSVLLTQVRNPLLPIRSVLPAAGGAGQGGQACQHPHRAARTRARRHGGGGYRYYSYISL